MRTLIVTAVAAECEAVLAPGAPEHADVVVVGVGPAESAANTSAALAASTYDLVLCAGIGGGFGPLEPGTIAVASAIVFADLGAETSDGFTPVSTLGFGREHYAVAPKLAVELADRTGGHLGTIVTVAKVSGSAGSADTLRGRFPDIVAEGMEGAGVAAAATAHGIAFGEIRAISNAVGPRDRDSWQIPTALTALGTAVRAAVS